MSKRGMAFLPLVFSVVAAGPAPAVLVTHTFSGVITAAEPPYAHLLGESFSGSMTHETGTPPGLCLTQWGGTSYRSFPPYDPALGIEIDVGGVEQFSSDDTQPLSLCVFDDNVLFDDAFLFWETNGLLVRLLDASESAFASEDLPVLLSAEDFDPRQVEFWGPGALVLTGRIEALERPQQVPALDARGLGVFAALLAGLGVAATRHASNP